MWSPKPLSIVPVILSGGIGDRLWPLSREIHPKQFIKLEDDESLIQKTYLRATNISDINEVVTVTHRNFLFHTKDEYQHLATNKVHNTFILEPFGRNSSAAIDLAAHYTRQKYGNDCLLLVLPADHIISQQDSFLDTITQAISLANSDRLVTFGIKIERPETGYGYIEAAGTDVKYFIEKPSLEEAKKYFQTDNFYWNSGILCMKSGIILDQINQFSPDISSTTSIAIEQAAQTKGKNSTQIEIQAKDFMQVPNISIDHAVFELSKIVSVVTCEMGWANIGSWLEFAKIQTEDESGNLVTGKTIIEDVTNCIIHSKSKMFAGLGLDNLIIADTQDALLVAHKNRAQDVRKIVNQLKRNADPTYKTFPSFHQHWGRYTTLFESTNFKLKYLTFKPCCALSLQSHQYRSEHWVVVKGVARIISNDEILLLQCNESTFIPIGNKYRIENPREEELIIIEIQCGKYLSEKDITLYDDLYGRPIS